MASPEPAVAPPAGFATRGRLLIDGEWVPAADGRTFVTVDPSNETPLGDVARGGPEDVDRAVRAARLAVAPGSPWRRMRPSDRGRLLHRVGDLILEHADELATLESLDNGKPRAIARVADVPLSADLFHYMAGWATKLEGATLPLSGLTAPGVDFHAYTRREPAGVVAQIIPWNFPLLMAAWKLGPALAAGCTVVLKPAEQTPLSALLLGELLLEAGLPAGVVNIVSGHGEAGAALAAHPDVDKVAFTGSTEVGRTIVRAAAGNLKTVSLELGGKSPQIVFADAELELAIPGAADAVFFNHGQCCCAGTRVYADRAVYDDVVAGIAERAKAIRLGPGLAPETEMGPLVSEQQLRRVCGFLDRGAAEGATAVAGGGRAGHVGYFVEPTVLVDTAPDMTVVREEIFGPVVTVMPFSDPDEVLTAANASAYGLAAGVWTRDLARAHRFAAALEAGTVWVNTYNVFDASLPFGGIKESGWGREMGREVLDHYLETKSVCIRL